MFSRRQFLKSVGMGLTAAALPGCAWQSKARGGKSGPNFVFILADDYGYSDVGCYNKRTFYETPNIDRLAAEGMKFTDAYAACPVCSPTRASILTGKYPARLHLTDWIPGRQRSGPPEKLIPPDFVQQLVHEEVTIAEALKEGGYATASIGKWHLGGKEFYPETQGFDVSIAGNERGLPPSYFYPYERGGGWKLDLAGGEPGEYLTDRFTDEALKFIEVNKDRPFLLYLPHYAVHVPVQGKKELVDKYTEKAARLPAEKQEPGFVPEGRTKERTNQNHAIYAAMVQSLDESVGRVMEKLRSLELQENTVVIFMSDNGGLSTSEGWPTSNLPLRAGKGWLYEGGIREPMIVKWPGVTKAGAVCSVPVTSTDFYPTMLEMAGLEAKPEQHSDGVSIVPPLRGKTLKRQALYWHYPHYSNQGGMPGGAVREGDYKLIEFYEDSRVELYNLKEDIGERRDLSAEMPEKTAELRAKLNDWRHSVGADMPRPNRDYKPAEGEWVS